MSQDPHELRYCMGRALIDGREADAIDSIQALRSSWPGAIRRRLNARQGEPLALRDDKGRTPLSQALALGRSQAARAAILAGSPMDAKDIDGMSALSLACAKGMEPCARLIAEHGGLDFQGDADGAGPLHWSAISDSPECVKFLLESKADINARDSKGRSALHRAAENSSLAAIQALLAAGADPVAIDSEACTPLIRACSRAHEEAALLILASPAPARKAGLDQDDFSGLNALRACARFGLPKAARRILELGGNPDAISKLSHGRSALWIACAQGQLEIIQALVEAGAKIDLRDQSGLSPMTAAACNGRIQAEHLLKNLGAAGHVRKSNDH